MTVKNRVGFNTARFMIVAMEDARGRRFGQRRGSRLLSHLDRGQPQVIVIAGRRSIHGKLDAIRFLDVDFGRSGRIASLRNHHRLVVAAGRTFQVNTRPSPGTGVLRPGRRRGALRLCPLFLLFPLVVLLDSIRHSLQTKEKLAFAANTATEGGYAIG